MQRREKRRSARFEVEAEAKTKLGHYPVALYGKYPRQIAYSARPLHKGYSTRDPGNGATDTDTGEGRADGKHVDRAPRRVLDGELVRTNANV